MAEERAEEERMKGDRAKGQKKEKSMGMLVREVRTKCEYKRCWNGRAVDGNVAKDNQQRGWNRDVRDK